MNYKSSLTKTHGFTLIEILIALFIFTIVSSITAVVLQHILRTREIINNKMATLSQIQTAVALIQQDMLQITNRPIKLENSLNSPAFLGDPYHIELTRTGMPQSQMQLQQSTLERVNYYVKDNALYRQTWPVLDRTINTLSQVRKILTDVESIQFIFYDQNLSPSTIWPLLQKSISSPLPRAIAIQFALKKGKIPLLIVIPTQPTVIPGDT